jgi:DNA repair protein RecN (Recombination protein N)
MRLLRLSIDDFGLIATASFTFAGGLTVFSGETGSGKTMLLGALRFALGERAEVDLIRGGAARARVVLEIEPDAALRAALDAAGIALADDDDVIITRELLASGRSQSRINGTAASASQVREIAQSLVDVVGQHAAQRLLAPAFALEIVDRFGGDDLLATRGEVRRTHREAQAIAGELAALRDDDGRARAQIEFARFALREIDDAVLDDADEDQRLRERRELLANAERIASALAAAHDALADDGGAADALGTAASALAGIARYGPAFAGHAAAAGALQSEVTELAASLAGERDAVEADPAEAESVGARLAQLDALKKKYGGTLAAVLETRATFAQTIDRDDNRDLAVAELETRLRDVRAALAMQAGRLSALRHAAARELEARVAQELGSLAMPAARFSVAFEPLDAIGPAGAERAELQLAANPGEPERPLAKSASGGELSRVLLAVIVALADRRDRTALVFDEIDAGIGGATAAAVGSRLGRLGQGAQVVVVTHLAQIASWAGEHYLLRKRDVRGTTAVEVERLDTSEARLSEIARMLSGEPNPASLEHAAVLVAGARNTI